MPREATLFQAICIDPEYAHLDPAYPSRPNPPHRFAGTQWVQRERKSVQSLG